MNPSTLLKIQQAKNKFTANHPKFVSFLKHIFSGEMEEETVIEITVTKPGKEPITANIKVLKSDVELFEGLKDLMGT